MLRHASAAQVQYGIVPGLYKHAATGMTRAYIQVWHHLLPCYSLAKLSMQQTCQLLRDMMLCCMPRTGCMLVQCSGVSPKHCLSAQQEQKHSLMCLMLECCMWFSQSQSCMQTYIHNQATYVSQLFHHVNVRDLPFGVPIYYK